ncbi:iron-containing alcohol dehydrogenase [Amorphus orientalis]|uniref:Alcohol dehydrogenase 2 n=1 Tax=Amorphus orientalis TaxID=649198 RepID=A0AAE3VT11_9HYPH|nr:iron-containing alcohol dehydrogenase [Amorphus orientalis]MDQ0317290.1 alcohol dehydrogenase class IV [Amorphus orientalis]
MTAPFTFNTVGSIVFGSGKAGEIGALAAARGFRRPLFITDPGLMGTGLIDPALSALAEAGLETAIFSEVEADPPEAIVRLGQEAARAHAADSVIGFGGGSSLDTAKLVALLATGNDTLEAAYGIGNAKGPRLPLMLVPTTAGTGSEVTPIAIVTTETSEKMGVVSPLLLPDVALLDPDLTLGLPAAVTAATGVDAMVHAIEAHASASVNNNPVSRALAREALRLMGGAIERAVANGSDADARADMLLGSMLAGQAFANSPVAAVHALAYPIGGHFHIPHGLSNALVLPHVIRFNAATAGPVYADLAPIVFPQLAEIGTQARGPAFADGLQELTIRCGLPPRLRDVGIPHDALHMMADDAMKQTRLLVNNPREVTRGDALAIYEAAW